MAKKETMRRPANAGAPGAGAAAGDPVVKILSAVIALMIVGFLLTIVFALVNGTIDLNSAIRTSEDNYVAKADLLIETGRGADGYQAKVEALLAGNEIDQAVQVVKEAEKKKLDVTQGDQINFMNALIATVREDHETAAGLYQQVVDNTKSAYETELKNGGEEKNWAKSYGLHDNYWRSVLGQAGAAIGQEKWEDALKYLNKYLKVNSREFGAIADRGEVKFQLGDIKGARADFEKAAKVLPEDPVVIEGLKKTAKDK